MAYEDRFRWQDLTEEAGLPMTLDTGLRFDVAPMAGEVEALEAGPGFRSMFGIEGWEAVALTSSDGDPANLARIGEDYEPTPAMELCPAMASAAESFDCRKARVRVVRLRPGASVPWHNDVRDAPDLEIVRVHIPVSADPGVESQLSHEDYVFGEGEAWVGDFSFPHRLRNTGSSDRVHLLVELVRDGYVDDLLGAGLPGDPSVRRALRNQCLLLLSEHRKGRRPVR